MSELIDLMLALRSNKGNEIESMLKHGTIDVNATLSGGGTPLQSAAGMGRAEIAELLLNAGARIDDADNRGETALHLAIANRHPAVVDLLIARGADLSVCNFNQFTPLALSVQHKTDRVAVALIRAGAPVDDEDSQVLVQLSAMSVAVVQLLVERSIDFSALRSDVSPLHAAAQRGENDNPALVRALIAAGVNRNARDRNGATPLHYCASSGYEDSLRALIQAGAGADVDVVDHDGLTPLHYACGSIKHNCAFVLLAAGADVCARDCNGQTAGHFASELVGVTLSPDTLHLLVAAGTDLDEVDLQGVSVRQMSTLDVPLSPTADERLAMLEKIARERFALVRARAFEICVAIQPLALNALQTVEILVHSCGPAAQLVPFHKWWALATTVKHFQD
jgi:ankyrin repeat protein